MTASRIWLLTALVLVTAVSLASYGGVLQLGWCDHDATVLVEVSRLQEPLDLLRFFGREVRDFVNPSTGFYRPWTNVSFALDHQLYGLDPTGYHVTDLLLHTGAALMLLVLLHQLGLSLWIAATVAVWFAAHPLGLEVVPSQARRGDTWAVLFLLFSAWSLLRARSGGRIWFVCAALTGVLALFSKETGVVLPLLWAVLPGPGRWWQRGGAAALLLAFPLGLRTVALQGAGGYREWTFWPWGLPDAGLDLLDPFRLLTGWGARLVALGMIASALLTLRQASPPSRRAVLAGTVWVGVLLGLTTLARGISAWYLYAPTVGMGLIIAGLLGAAQESLGARRGLARAGMGLAAALLLLPAFVGSPLFHAYPEWAEVSRVSALFLEGSHELASDAVTAELESGVEKKAALVAGVPRVVFLRPEPRFRVRSSHALGDYSVRKGLALFAGREVPVEALAYAHINELGARWAVIPRWVQEEEGWVLRLRMEGPVRMWPPRLDGLVAEGILGTRNGGPDWATVTEVDGELEVRDLLAPVWVWNGDRLERVPPPPGPPAPTP